MLPVIGLLGQAGSGKDTAGRFLVKDHRFYSVALADAIKLFCGWMFDWSGDQLWGPSENRTKEDERYPVYLCPACRKPYVHEDPGAEKEALLGCVYCGHVAQRQAWAAFLSPRLALQHLGTEWVRSFHSAAHVAFTLRRIKALQAWPVVHADPVARMFPDNVFQEKHGGGGDPRIDGVYVSDVRFRNEVKAIRDAGGRVFRIKRTTTAADAGGIANHASEQEQLAIADDELDGVIDNNDTQEQLQRTMASVVSTL